MDTRRELKRDDLLLKELALLQKINGLLFEGASRDVILQEIANGLCEKFDYLLSVVHLYDPKEHCLVNLSYCADSRLVRLAEELTGLKVKGYEIPVDKGSMFHKALTERKPVITKDITRLAAEHVRNSHLKHLAPVISKSSGIKYGVGVPLVAGSRVLGIIGIGSKKRLMGEDVKILESFGIQAGLAVAKAETDERLREYSRELEALVEKRTKALEDEKNRAEFYVDLMSHDIQNFNTIALGHLELLLGEGEMSDEERGLVDIVYSAIQKSSNLIDNVKKLQTRGGKFEKRSLHEVLSKAIEQTKVKYRGRGVQVNYEKKEVHVYSDELIEDLFINLLDNSVKHCLGEKVIIDMMIEDADRQVKICIMDNGVGVPDESKEIIFERFEKLGEGVPGSGLGLHLVKTLTDKYGGSVWVQDRVKGDPAKGSVFCVTLPKGS